MLIDFDIPPEPPPNGELENELNPPKPLPKPFEKKSSSLKLEKPPNPPKLDPFLPFRLKNELKKSASSSLSNPEELKKCLNISSALWKLKLVP